MGQVKALIVEDDSLFRDMLAAVLAAQPDIEVVATASSGEEAIHLALRLSPAAVVMDLDLDGMEAGKIIKGLPLIPASWSSPATRTVSTSPTFPWKKLKVGSASSNTTPKTPRR